MDSIDILKVKREKFAISLRKQKNETIFSKRREKYLTKFSLGFNQTDSTQNFDIRNIDLHQNLSQILGQCPLHIKLTNMNKLQLYLAYISKNNSQSSYKIQSKELRTIIPTLLNLIHDYLPEGQQNYAIIAQTVSLLINITFFLTDNETEQMIELRGFYSLFQLIQSTSKDIQVDSMDLLLNICISLSPEQFGHIIQKSNMYWLIINIYADDNNQLSYSFIKKSLKLMIQGLTNSNYNFSQQLLEDALDMATSIVEKEDSTIKLKTLAVRLMKQVFQKIENKDRWTKTSLKQTLNDLLNMENYKSTQLLQNFLIEQTLSVLIVLFTESDEWILSLLNEGLLHSLMYLIQHEVCEYQRVHQKIIQTCCLLFLYQFQNEEADKILNNQQDLVENILQSLNYVMKLKQELPIYSLKLITILTLTDGYLEQVLSSINYFKMMCMEVQRHNFIQSDNLDIIFWLKSIENSLLFGMSNNQLETYIGQFLMYDGEKIIDILQQNSNENVLQLTQKILSIIE